MRQSEGQRIVGCREFAWLNTGRPDVLAFRNGRGVSATNMGTEPYTVPDVWGALVLTSTKLTDRRLPADSTAWLRVD